MQKGKVDQLRLLLSGSEGQWELDSLLQLSGVPADWPLVGPYDTRTLITYRERLRGSHVAVPGRFWPDADDGWKDLLFKCEIHGSTRGFKFKGPGAARRNGLGQGMAFQIYDVKYEYEYVCAATDLAAFIADHGINPPDAKFA